MWDVVFQPFWISGRSGQESFRDTSEKKKREERGEVDEWMRYAGVIACGPASVQGMFPVAHGGPEGRDESRINNTTPDSDAMLARILCEEESILRKIDGLVVRSLDRVTE